MNVMHETLRQTNLGELKSGSKVNLERAMAANGRFGGHIVAGHVDGTGTISSMKRMIMLYGLRLIHPQQY